MYRDGRAIPEPAGLAVRDKDSKQLVSVKAPFGRRWAGKIPISK